MNTPNYYEIKIKGQLDKSMTDWFEGLTAFNQEDGDAILAGHLPDQAALQGVINRISSLGLTLISVNSVPDEDGRETISILSEKENILSTNPTFIERYSLSIFMVLTPLISLAIPLFLKLPTELVPLIMILVPAFMAVLLTTLSEGGKGVIALLQKLVQWRIPFKWIVISLGLAFGLRLAMSLLALLFGWIPSIQLNTWSPQQFLIIGIFTLIGAVMEELGWRGYALPKLLSQRSALASALLIGIPWGVLHIGLVLPGQMNAGTSWLGTVLSIIGLSVVLTWLFIQTKGNLIVVILYHAGENFFVFLNGGISITQSLGLLNVVTIALATVLIIVYGVNLQQNSEKKEPLVDAR